MPEGPQDRSHPGPMLQSLHKASSRLLLSLWTRSFRSQSEFLAEGVETDAALFPVRPARFLDEGEELRIIGQSNRLPVGAGQVLDGCQGLTLARQDNDPRFRHL